MKPHAYCKCPAAHLVATTGEPNNIASSTLPTCNAGNSPNVGTPGPRGKSNSQHALIATELELLLLSSTHTFSHPNYTSQHRCSCNELYLSPEGELADAGQTTWTKPWPAWLGCQALIRSQCMSHKMGRLLQSKMWSRSTVRSCSHHPTPEAFSTGSVTECRS